MLTALILIHSTVLGCWPKPDGLTLSVQKGVNNEIVNLAIDGEKFAKSVVVKLTRTDQPEILADNVQVISRKQVTCTLDLRGKAAGVWDVTVINMNRFLWFNIPKSVTIAGGFTIEYPAPSLDRVEPNQAVNNAKQALTILGHYFRPGAKVTLNNGSSVIPALQLTSIGESQIVAEFDLNGVDAGVYSVKVTNDDGKSGELPDSLTVNSPAPTESPKPVWQNNPEISAIDPDRGFNNGVIRVEIDGFNFVPGLQVKMISGDTEIPGSDVEWKSDSEISCTFDLNGKPVGSYQVVVTNPDGQEAVQEDGFSVEAFVAPQSNRVLQPVFFDFDSWRIRPDQVEALEENLQVLLVNEKLYVILGGHADERGTREYNQGLTVKRAQAVKDYLVGRGIAPERVVIYAYGEDFPAKKGHDETAWQYNRRVDILCWDVMLTREEVLAETGKTE